MAMCVMAASGVAFMPVLPAGWKPDHITGPDLLDGAACALGPTAPGGDDDGLTGRMRMPCGPRTRLEGDSGALNKRWIGRLKKPIDTDRAGEPLRRSLDG